MEDGRKVTSINYNKNLEVPKVDESVWIYWDPQDAVIINQKKEYNELESREKVRWLVEN